MSGRGLDELLSLRGVDGEGFFAQDGLAGLQAEHGVLVVVRVWRGDVDDVDVLVGHQVFVGAVGSGGGGAFAVLEEFSGPVGRGR